LGHCLIGVGPSIGHLSRCSVYGVIADFEDVVGPNSVEDQQDGEKTIEDVVGREHFNDLGSLNGGAVQYPRRKDPQPGDDPGDCEEAEDDVAGLLKLGVVTHLGQLKEHVGKVVDHQDQRATPGEVAGPGE